MNLSATLDQSSTGLWPSIRSFFLGPGSISDFGERFLILSKSYETSVRGMYAIGDVTGSPDIKAALNAGYHLAQTLISQPAATDPALDTEVLIIGAGPAGLNLASELLKAGRKVRILERKRSLQTIRAFAASKPLYLASTGESTLLGDFPFKDCLSGDCLKDWERLIDAKKLPIEENATVTEVKKRGAFEVWYEDAQGQSKSLLAAKVVVAIGKPRLLEKVAIQGATDARVSYQTQADLTLSGKKLLVLAHAGSYEGYEMALAMAEKNSVTVISEQSAPDLSSPVMARIQAAVAAKTLHFSPNTRLASIREGEVEFEAISAPASPLSQLMSPELSSALLRRQSGEKWKIENDRIFSGRIIDRELPATDLRAFGLTTERRMSVARWIGFGLLFAFFAFIYVAKSNGKAEALRETPGLRIIGQTFINYRHSAEEIVTKLASSSPASAILALSLMALAFQQLGAAWRSGFAGPGKTLDKALLLLMGTAIILVSAGPALILQANIQIGLGPKLQLYQLWSLVYSAAIVVFGFKAIGRYRSQYRDAEQGHHQTRRLLTLMLFQLVFLCILPEVVLRNWRAYGLVLAWPLNLNPASYAGFIEVPGEQVLSITWPVQKKYSLNSIYFVWTLILTFILIPILVWRGGMRYCTWICSCGGLAETVGDEFRHFSPKGPANTRREWLMYFVLGLTALVMVLAIADHHNLTPGALSLAIAQTVKAWSWIVDLALCGIIPLVLYPFMSGRTWCRYACPTAGFMKLLGRKIADSGIQPDKARCIACGQCDRYCEVGVPIKKHALKGEFFSALDTTCISCGVCISVCPTDTLRFTPVPRSKPLPMAV